MILLTPIIYFINFMLRPFRAEPDFDVFPGRCPGLLCHTPSGLPKILRFMEVIIQYQKKNALPCRH